MRHSWLACSFANPPTRPRCKWIGSQANLGMLLYHRKYSMQNERSPTENRMGELPKGFKRRTATHMDQSRDTDQCQQREREAHTSRGLRHYGIAYAKWLNYTRLVGSLDGVTHKTCVWRALGKSRQVPIGTTRVSLQL